jgi:succinate dehydrogenase / fumarate reductase membrane anchor subunit
MFGGNAKGKRNERRYRIIALSVVLTLLFFISLFYHAWIGIRDIWMDYIKPVSIRLTLQVLTVLYLVACAAYAVQILWKV